MSRFQSSLPAKSKAASMPVPVIAQTWRPSVTGDGDDMFCFIWRRSPPDSSRFHRVAPVLRSSAHRCSDPWSATLRKMWSPQTIGVEPEYCGTATFQATFSVVDHLTGRFFSPLMPLSVGPRHCGQFSAPSGLTSIATATPVPNATLRMHPFIEVTPIATMPAAARA